MNLLEKKLARYDIPQKAKAAGIYPYFRAISSEQDCEVVINGKKILIVTILLTIIGLYHIIIVNEKYNGGICNEEKLQKIFSCVVGYDDACFYRKRISLCCFCNHIPGNLKRR